MVYLLISVNQESVKIQKTGLLGNPSYSLSSILFSFFLICECKKDEYVSVSNEDGLLVLLNVIGWHYRPVLLRGNIFTFDQLDYNEVCRSSKR